MDIILFLFILAILLSVAYACLSLAPWLPTRKNDISRILGLAALGEGDCFFDLGAGDGRVALAAAANPGVRATGVEIALPFFLYAHIRGLLSGRRNLRFVLGDLYRVDLADADAVYFFAASPAKISGRLAAKLARELKPGARVISYAFPVPDWTADIVSRPAPDDLPIYLYRR